jgi:steroid delta-isomerase-like uncharacterized protein
MSPEERKRRVRQHIDLSWCKGRLALAEQLQSRYFSYKSSLVAQPVNSAGFALLVREVRLAMPDLEVAVDECLSDGNRVVTSSTVFGTLITPAFGYEPSNKILTIAAMSIWTLNPAGDIEEINTLFDLESARQQLSMPGPIL